MNYAEEDLIPLSAVQHVMFCERQCALIHVEQVWDENLFTAQGRIMHERVHDRDRESRGDVRTERGLPLRSLRLGLIGKADVVEFHRTESGTWQPFPVEYKRGKTNIDVCDRVQLCAQAMCLEEMLSCEIEYGAIFYGRPRRRERVKLTAGLRERTESLTDELHRLYEAGATPRAKYQKKCGSCSLYETCMPKVTGIAKNINHYLAKALEET